MGCACLSAFIFTIPPFLRTAFSLVVLCFAPMIHAQDLITRPTEEIDVVPFELDALSGDLPKVLENFSTLPEEVSLVNEDALIRALDRSISFFGCPNCFPSGGGAVPDTVTANAEVLRLTNENARALLEYRESRSNLPCDRTITNFVQRSTITNYRAYASQCGITNYDQLVRERPAFKDYIFRIGAFKKGRAIFCTGVLISSSVILTARHCFPDKSSIQGVSFLPLNEQYPGEIGNLSLEDAACDFIHRNTLTYQSCDYIKVLAPSPIDGITGEMEVSTAIPDFQPLQVVGFSPRQYSAAKADDKTASWKSGVVGTLNPLCSAYSINRVDVISTDKAPYPSACVLHGCQTVGGMSGSPIFFEDEGKAKLFGVHIGSSMESGHWSPTNTCGFDSVTSRLLQVNLGVAYER